MLEGYTALGFLAGRDVAAASSGCWSPASTYRHPGLLAQDRDDARRAVRRSRDARASARPGTSASTSALGVPYPSTQERFERLEETILVLRQMFSDDDGPFEGEHYRLAETINNPQIVRPGGPRLVIGGGGERKTLRLVAQYGDATNLFAAPVEDLQHKLDVLRGHCDDLGRDYDEIAKTFVGSPCEPARGPRRVARPLMEQYAAIGIEPAVDRPGRRGPGRLDRADVEEVVPPAGTRSGEPASTPAWVGASGRIMWRICSNPRQARKPSTSTATGSSSDWDIAVLKGSTACGGSRRRRRRASGEAPAEQALGGEAGVDEYGDRGRAEDGADLAGGVVDTRTRRRRTAAAGCGWRWRRAAPRPRPCRSRAAPSARGSARARCRGVPRARASQTASAVNANPKPVRIRGCTLSV